MATGLMFSAAGVGGNSFGGDGAVATSAYLSNPSKVVFDTLGGFYICDRANQRIRYVTASGLISTFAGTGNAGFTQDSLPPLSTYFYNPEALALDIYGNVVINDVDNRRIRGIYPTAPTAIPTIAPSAPPSVQVVETVVGNGANSYPIDGASATSTPAGTPRDCLFDSSNNLYYSDINSFTVRVVYAATGLSYTFAGTYRSNGNTVGLATSSMLYQPHGLTWDYQGNMLVADVSNHNIKRINMATNLLSLVAGTGGAGYNQDYIQPNVATLYTPYNAISDSVGNLYIADFNNCRIRKIASNVIYTFAGTGGCGSGDDGYPATSTAIANPGSIAFGPGQTFLYYPEWSGQRVKKINMATTIVYTIAGNGGAGYCCDGGPATSANLYTPAKVVVDPQGGIYFTDYSTHRVRYVSPAGLIYTAVGNGAAGFNYDDRTPLTTTLYNPYSVTLGYNGVRIYVTDTNNYRIRGVFTSAPTAIPTSAPSSTAFTSVVSTYAGTGSGAIGIEGSNAATSTVGNPNYMIFDASNNLYYSEYNYCQIRVINSATGTSNLFAGSTVGTCGVVDGARTSAQFGHTAGVAWDYQGNMLVTDTSNGHSTRRITLSTGIVQRIAGLSTGGAGYTGDRLLATSSALNYPQNAISDASGNVYISDYNNCYIRRIIASTGLLMNFAGTGSCGANAADGWAATLTTIAYPTGLSFDSSYANLYYTEWSNYGAVRKINMATNQVRVVAGLGGNGLQNGVPATTAWINYCSNIVFDRQGQGFFYVSRSDHLIRYVTADGIVTTYAGNGAAGFTQDGLAATATNLYYPYSVAIDGNGQVYINDESNYRIRKVTSSRIF